MARAVDISDSRKFWHKYLGKLPKFTCGELDKYISDNKAVKVTSERGYKFFLEGYVHDFEVCDQELPESQKWAVRTKCFHSQKKSEAPHTVQVKFKSTAIVSTACSCAAGKGLCHHTIATIYQLQHYKKLNLKSVPPVQSKTSLLQVFFTVRL